MRAITHLGDPVSSPRREDIRFRLSSLAARRACGCFDGVAQSGELIVARDVYRPIDPAYVEGRLRILAPNAVSRMFSTARGAIGG